LVPGRGYGFIQEDGRTDEIEFHWSALELGNLEQLRVGQYVEFERVPDHRDPRRERAIRIRLVGG
jgi:cold shock CspA family protein